MGTTTTTYALNKPTVGGDDNAWGTDLNANADKIDDLLDGTTAIKPNLTEGQWKVGGVAVTASAAELNVLDGVTASTAELNILDGLTASTAELNILDGATLTTTELNYVDGVTSAIQTQLDAKYDSGDIASQGEAEAGTDNTKVMTPMRVAQAARPQTATAVASTSGTAIDFTGIPSWAKRVTVMFSGVSTNGASFKVLRIGTSGGIAATGYQSGVFAGVVAGQFSISTTDFVLSYTSNSGANATMHGAFILTNLSGNTWVLNGSYAEPTQYGVGGAVGGSITLGATLDRIRITTANGTDTFDAGSINVMWE